MKKTYIIFVLIFLAGNIFATETWDLIDKSMNAWDANGNAETNKAWTKYVGSNVGNGYAITQGDDFVNLTKTAVGGQSHSVLINSQNIKVAQNTSYTIEFEARINPLDKAIFPDESGVGYESNLISARINKKVMNLYLRYADKNNEKGSGYAYLQAAVEPLEEDLHYLDISDWHLYRFVLSADNTKYDVYIDGELVFEGVMTIGMDSQTNILRFGADIRTRCNIDVKSARIGTGDFNSKSKISTVTIGSDSHIAGNERTISVSANTILIKDGEQLQVSLTDEVGVEIVTPVKFTVKDNKAETKFTIPASVSKGMYAVKVSVPSDKVSEIEIAPITVEYVVTGVSPFDMRMFPQLNPISFVKEIEDYQYIGPSKEFIFPSIVDTKQSTVEGKFANGQEPIARYYLFYTPHENPGGMYLSTAAMLDGPWTEQNTVIDLAWAKAVSESHINIADHISACQVVWNDELKKYIMYFHGPNSTTHYATSDNLKDWKFGASILNANQFSTGGKEASYAKVFEHRIPGLNNKYIMLLMVQENNIRRIYWAHSVDGIGWTPVKKPLVSPDLDFKKVPGTEIKPDYTGQFGNNVSGPALFVKDGRNFVFCHGSSGNMFVVEVGENFDMEIHWGEYMKADDFVVDTDMQGNPKAVSRIAAPVFIQNDEEQWYMFVEAGSRLGANIAYAKEIGTQNSVQKPINVETVFISGNLLNVGEALSITSKDNISLSEVALYDIAGSVVYRKSTSGNRLMFNIPASAGVYLLIVNLDNNTSHEFKILVK